MGIASKEISMIKGKRKCRFQAIIIQNDSILFLKQRGIKTRLPYWMLPGGALIDGESISDGITREFEEEICVAINIERLIQRDVLDTEYYEYSTFLCSIKVGSKIMPGEEGHFVISKFEWILISDILSGKIENKIKQVQPQIHSIIRNLE